MYITSYSSFFDKISKENVHTIFELGSRYLLDAVQLFNEYQCKVYAFECNPDCLIECRKNINIFSDIAKNNIILVDKVVSNVNGPVSFFPFDLTKYNNMGSSSMLKIDFSMRNPSDPDYNRECPQKEVIVNGTRLDTFIGKNNITNIDLLCIDLQGYELNAIKSLGDHLHNVKYIITESSIHSTYLEGASFEELNEYLITYGFTYVSSNVFGSSFPNLSQKGFSEFDAFFVHTSLL